MHSHENYLPTSSTNNDQMIFIFYSLSSTYILLPFTCKMILNKHHKVIFPLALMVRSVINFFNIAKNVLTYKNSVLYEQLL